MGLRDLQITTLCFYSYFKWRPNFFGIGCNFTLIFPQTKMISTFRSLVYGTVSHINTVNSLYYLNTLSSEFQSSNVHL